ncbi:MAG: DUF1259 domain-containing protein [Pseudomonadota bacterium]|jgi:hypothetical protein|uniref:DUF1259 domain-containing protein n=1 Tax=Phenylobacterium sp. TaxID=1871053 RepID=UPI001A20E28E|nr:DUF1259 domain-containing protein [Phenylobacterium sp.]MBJ7410230.1 DUF1259 domain-containing protein [Phenylobacterium sp.]
MKRVTFALALVASVFGTHAANAAPDWGAVGRALGKEGAVQPGGVYRVGLPRTDLKVTLDGVPIRPALALGSWLAFQDMGDHTMVMGDLVLTHEEVNPVMKVLVENGLEVTALHNHLLRSAPATMYMHVGGHGDPVKLAAALRKAIAQSKTPMGAPSAGAAPAPAPALDMAGLDRTLGYKGKANGGIYQFSVPRAEPVREAGAVVPEAMGSATVINFQPTGAGKAAITGDFVLTAEEVNPVIRALRANGIEVTALHNHMLDDDPRLFFMHFWANDDALKLARGLRTALGHVKVARP